jgi:hypothetical protein
MSRYPVVQIIQSIEQAILSLKEASSALRSLPQNGGHPAYAKCSHCGATLHSDMAKHTFDCLMVIEPHHQDRYFCRRGCLSAWLLSNPPS